MTIRRADDTSYTLASNASATGSAVSIKGGEYLVTFEGTIGGATVSLQMKSPNGTWMTVQVFSGASVQYTVIPIAQTGISLPACDVRMAVTGGAPSGLYCYLIGAG